MFEFEAAASSAVSSILFLCCGGRAGESLVYCHQEAGFQEYVPQKTLKLSTHIVGCEFSVIETVAVGQIFVGLLHCTPP